MKASCCASERGCRHRRHAGASAESIGTSTGAPHPHTFLIFLLMPWLVHRRTANRPARVARLSVTVANFLFYGAINRSRRRPLPFARGPLRGGGRPFLFVRGPFLLCKGPRLLDTEPAPRVGGPRFIDTRPGRTRKGPLLESTGALQGSRHSFPVIEARVQAGERPFLVHKGPFMFGGGPRRGKQGRGPIISGTIVGRCGRFSSIRRAPQVGSGGLRQAQAARERNIVRVLEDIGTG